MRLITETGSLAPKLGDHGALEAIANAGFDGVDYSMMTPDSPAFSGSWQREGRALNQHMADLGLVPAQAHAPFGFRYEDYLDGTLRTQTAQAVRFAGELGIPRIVVHPVACPAPIDEIAFHREFLAPALAYSREYGVSIALENMWLWDPQARIFRESVCGTPQTHRALADALDTDLCLDVGHCVLVGQDPAGAVEELGPRLGCLHIHDNNGCDDDHLLPFSGCMDWPGVMAALARTGYAGDLTLECSGFFSRLPRALLAPGLSFAARVGRELLHSFHTFQTP